MNSYLCELGVLAGDKIRIRIRILSRKGAKFKILEKEFPLRAWRSFGEAQDMLGGRKSEAPVIQEAHTGRKMAQAAKTFKHSSTRFFPDCAGKKRFALSANSRFW